MLWYFASFIWMAHVEATVLYNTIPKINNSNIPSIIPKINSSSTSSAIQQFVFSPNVLAFYEKSNMELNLEISGKYYYFSNNTHNQYSNYTNKFVRNNLYDDDSQEKSINYDYEAYYAYKKKFNKTQNKRLENSNDMFDLNDEESTDTSEDDNNNFDDVFEETKDEDNNEANEEQDDEEKDDPDYPFDTQSFDYKKQKVNGINLGGWLVTEPFISPSLYEKASKDGTEANTPVDEYNFCESLGFVEAYSRLKAHWETWITEEDIIKIKNYGFNAVRLPIGYWAFARLPNDPYVFGQEEYLQKTIVWCRIHGLKMWIDLHGIPGSQNGFDNSGRRDVYEWMQAGEQNYNLGIHVLKYIYDKYGGSEYSDVIIGYENLNEPLHNRYEIPKILQFDQITYRMLRAKTNNYFVYHDAFLNPFYWQTEMNEPQYINTILDHHRYEVFDTNQLKESVDGHITSSKNLVNMFLQIPKIQIVGEWSAALTDCAKWLNGVGRGARYDNTFEGNGFIGACRFSNNVEAMNEQDRINTRRIIEAQLDIFNQTNGFFYWTYKTENAIEWSMSALADEGLFPVPLYDRKYPKVV